MIRTLLLALCLSLASALPAKTREKVTFFARTLCQKAQLAEGDSCLVSCVLYSSVPFTRVECKIPFKLKHAAVRPVRFNRDATVRRVVEDGQVLYRMVWSQHMVRPLRKGKLVLPRSKFKAVFTYYKADARQYFRFFGGRPETVTATETARSPRQCIEVLPPPRRSTQEMMEEGENVF